MDNNSIRRMILRLLYDTNDQYAGNALEQDEIAVKLGVPVHKVRLNLVYLSSPEKGLVSMHSITDKSGRTFLFATITSAGIDLVDDPSEFNQRYPLQLVQQTIQGDLLNVTIGEHATGVTVGKDINQTYLDNDYSIVTACSNCATLIRQKECTDGVEDDVLSCLKRLQVILSDSNPDLAEVLRIKRTLMDLEGNPPNATKALFSDPSVVAPIRLFVCEIIGGY